MVPETVRPVIRNFLVTESFSTSTTIFCSDGVMVKTVPPETKLAFIRYVPTAIFSKINSPFLFDKVSAISLFSVL